MRLRQNLKLHYDQLTQFFKDIPEDTRSFLIQHNLDFNYLWKTYNYPIEEESVKQRLDICLSKDIILELSIVSPQPLHILSPQSFLDIIRKGVISHYPF